MRVLRFTQTTFFFEATLTQVILGSLEMQFRLCVKDKSGWN